MMEKNELKDILESTISDGAELTARLQFMKRLLKKKERSLTRYNRAKAKDVRNIVLRKNFENFHNGCEESRDQNNCTTSDDISRNLKSSDLSKENPFDSEDVKKDQSSNLNGKSDSQYFHKIPSALKTSSASRHLASNVDQNLNTRIIDSNSTTRINYLNSTTRIIDPNLTTRITDSNSNYDSNSATRIIDSNSTTIINDSYSTTRINDPNLTTRITDSNSTTKIIDSNSTTIIIDSNSTSIIIDSNSTTRINDPNLTTRINDPNLTTRIIDSNSTTRVIDSNSTTRITDSNSTTRINDPNLTTPVLHRKRVIRHNIFNKNKYVKSLFQNNNNNIDNKCHLKDSCCRDNKSSCGEELHYTSATTCEHLEDLKSFTDDKKYTLNSSQENNFEDEPRMVKDHCGTPLKQPVIVRRYNSFGDAFKEDVILHSCLSLPTNGSPYALILSNRKFSIYNFRKVESADSFLWQQCHHQESDKLLDLNTRKFCSLGGDLVDFVYFIIIKAPKTAGCSFEMIFLSFSLKEELGIIQKSLPLQGCPTCLFSGHNIQLWSFLFLHHCENPSCPNSSTEYHGTFNTITFDLKYSQKRQEWDVELERCERQRVSHCQLATVNLLHEYTLNSSLECPNILWQDCYGKLGTASQGCSFQLFDQGDSREFQEEIASGLIIFAAVVKEILLLILKMKENLKILAVNPLSGQVEVLGEIKLRDITPIGNSCSVVFYQNKFLVSSEEEVFSLDL